MIMNQKKTNAAKPGRGGVRPGAGRPKGSGNKITVQGLVDEIQRRSGGQSYEEILVEDFLKARLENDRMLTHKYHNLISSKVLAERIDIEIDEGNDTVAAKQAAFEAALAKLAGKSNDAK